MTVNLTQLPIPVELTTSQAQETQESAIEVRNLVKRYHGASGKSVDNISFTVQRGEIFGLLGPNGAGKTTTIGILTAGIRPTSGTASIMGFDVARDPVGVKQHIAVMSQRSNLDLSLSAREILTFHASYHSVPRVERNARADVLLKELGMEGQAKNMPRTFSGGQAQRLMLARALMHSPKVLFLDEPTNNLDPQSRLFLWERIQDLRENGVTILLTTHDMEEADRLCDRIAIMDHGQILILDTPGNLKKVIPGGARLDLYVHLLDSPETKGNSILAALRALPGALKVELVSSSEESADQDGSQNLYHFYAKEANRLIVPAIQAISEGGGELFNLHLAHPSLENVFIYLTGRKLRS